MDIWNFYGILKCFLYLYNFYSEEALTIFCGTLVEEPAVEESFPLNIIIWYISLRFVYLCLCLLACYIPRQLAGTLVKEFNKSNSNYYCYYWYSRTHIEAQFLSFFSRYVYAGFCAAGGRSWSSSSIQMLQTQLAKGTVSNCWPNRLYHHSYTILTLLCGYL